MAAPIIVRPRQHNVEAFQFTDAQSAHDIASWMMKAADGRPDGSRVSAVFESRLNARSRFSFSIGEESYELYPGDWVIKDGDLFSVCRRADFSYLYEAVEAGNL